MGSTKTWNVERWNAATENPERGTEKPRGVEQKTRNAKQKIRNAFLLICVIYRYCYELICHHYRDMVTNFVYTYKENPHIVI